MPSKSPAQKRLMQAVAHSPKFAKKVGIPTSVGKEFVKADKGMKSGAIAAYSALADGISSIGNGGNLSRVNRFISVARRMA